VASFVHVNMHGQVTLPASTRKKHGIKPGSTLSVVDKGSEIVLRKAKVVDEHILDELARIFDERGITNADIERDLRKIRNTIHKDEDGG